MDCYNENLRWQALIKELDNEKSLDSYKQLLDKLADDTDEDYAWFLVNLCKQKQTIQKQTKVIPSKDVNEHDPQYAMFLSSLIRDGTAYKLKITKDDESSCILVYEKPEESNEYCGYVTTGDDEDNVNSSENRRVKRRVSEENRNILTTQEVSRENKASEHNTITEVHQGIPEASCYQLLLEGNTPSEYGAFQYAGKSLKYEEKVKSSSCDSDMEILDNVTDFSEVKNKALVPAKETLRKELIQILEKPYTNEEYDGLYQYVFEEKAICRHLDLRDRPISSVLKEKTKSLFEDSPVSFQVMFRKNENDRLKALNLLRMLCFWLVHVPSEDAFKPWDDGEIREVLPRPGPDTTGALYLPAVGLLEYEL